MGTVGTMISVRKNTSGQNVKILKTAKTQKNCQKWHPKRYKRYASGNCRFENGCAYKHQKPTTNEDHEQRKEKFQKMEKVLHTMTMNGFKSGDRS